MTNSSPHALLWHTLGQAPKSLWELVQLYPSVTPLRTAVCFYFFFFLSVPHSSPHICFARVSKVRAVSYPSLEVTAVRKCSAPRQSTVDRLWLPRETHSPHNNELLRLPEDTTPVRRIEIKRQVREVRRTSEEEVGGGGGGVGGAAAVRGEADTGGNEFSIRRTWELGAHWDAWEDSSAASKCSVKAPLMAIKLQFKAGLLAAQHARRRPHARTASHRWPCSESTMGDWAEKMSHCKQAACFSTSVNIRRKAVRNSGCF